MGNRITPADAGKTHSNFINLLFLQDHPRGCGENRELGLYIVKKRGSPPRMRGKLVGNTVFVPSLRITPADAGKTTDSEIGTVPAQDHPRGCGENHIR